MDHGISQSNLSHLPHRIVLQCKAEGFYVPTDHLVASLYVLLCCCLDGSRLGKGILNAARRLKVRDSHSQICVQAAYSGV